LSPVAGGETSGTVFSAGFSSRRRGLAAVGQRSNGDGGERGKWGLGFSLPARGGFIPATYPLDRRIESDGQQHSVLAPGGHWAASGWAEASAPDSNRRPGRLKCRAGRGPLLATGQKSFFSVYLQNTVFDEFCSDF
jgi:hypothetical protein